MPAAWVLTPPYFLAFAFLCGVAGFRIGWRTGNRVALLLMQSTLGWVSFLLAWRMVGPGWAAVAVGSWVVGTSLASIYVFIGHPRETDERVVHAASYRVTMLNGLDSGAPEKTPTSMATKHVREAIWYTAAAIVTANFGSMAMGAMLLNEMNAYVATLLRAARRTGTVVLLAWNVWSIVRVAAYVLIGAAAAAPLLRMYGSAVDTSTVRILAVVGAIGVPVDIVLKLLLSGPCGRSLVSAIDLAAARENRSSAPSLTLHLDD